MIEARSHIDWPPRKRSHGTPALGKQAQWGRPVIQRPPPPPPPSLGALATTILLSNRQRYNADAVSPSDDERGWNCRNDIPVEYSGEEQTICAVGLAKPKTGIFVEGIQHLLVVCTPVEVQYRSFFVFELHPGRFCSASDCQHALCIF